MTESVFSFSRLKKNFALISMAAMYGKSEIILNKGHIDYCNINLAIRYLSFFVGRIKRRLPDGHIFFLVF